MLGVRTLSEPYLEYLNPSPTKSGIDRRMVNRHARSYWTGWFASLGDGDMKETNLNLFYEFGQAMNTLYESVKSGNRAIDAAQEIFNSQLVLTSFLKETEEYGWLLGETRKSAQELLDAVSEIVKSVQVNMETPLTPQDVSLIYNGKWNLDRNFEHERKNLSVFAVVPKGLLDTRLLIQQGERKFGDVTRSVFIERVIYDLRQAGRCLAFEIPTAMAFHVMRATETLIKSYYEVLAGNPWPHAQRDWGKYIAELEKFSAVNSTIITRLKEIKLLNRNPLVHPEDVVSLEEAPVIFDLCNGVIYFMAEEIRKRKQPNVNARIN